MSTEPGIANPLGPLSSLRWWRMTQKELREILRDRRTILTLIGMPLLIYPLLGVTFQKLLVSQATQKTNIEYRVAVANQRDSRILNRILHQTEPSAAEGGKGSDSTRHEPAGTVDDPDWSFLVPDQADTTIDLDQLISDRSADVGVRLKPGNDEGPWDFELVFRSSSPLSLDARRAVEERLRAFNELSVAHYLRMLDPPLAIPIAYSHRQVAAADSVPAFSMANLIPLILILMTVTGTVYPAIDLTAGERERGTLEALISAPVPRHELLFAKYLAVLAVAMLTALANLTSMVVTAYSYGMEQLLFDTGGINVRMLGLMFGLLILFAGFFAAVILILTSFARSFKEAQAYLIPVMLVSMAPGVLCLLPGIEMSAWMAVTPLVNIVILARDVFDGHAQPMWVLLTLLSTVLYSAVALAVAAKIFGTDAVLYGSEGSWTDLVRRPTTRQPAASLSQAMTSLAILLPSFLILSGLPRRFAAESIAVWMAGNAVLTILLFAVFPLVLARWTAVDYGSGLRLRRANVLSFVAAILFGLSLWPFAIELGRMQMPSLEHYAEQFKQVTRNLEQIPLPAKLIALALIPAICEELYFRGYLLTAFRTGMSVPLSIMLSSILFGLFHVVTQMSFERFLPTTFLGLILGCICYRTGSVLPGMAMHATHNGLIFLLDRFKDDLAKWGIGDGSEEHVPATWLAVASLVVAAAAVTLVLANRSPQTEDPSTKQAAQDPPTTSLPETSA